VPFGSKCEFKDFAACVRHYTGKVEDPKAYCAVLESKTAEHCKRVTSLNGTRANGSTSGRRPWTFDAQTGRYQDAEGNVLSDADVRALLGRFLETQSARAAAVTESLIEGSLAVGEWEAEMRSLIKDTFGASYLLGRGGRNMMEFGDWGRLGAMTRRQYTFLNAFASDVASGSQSRARALQRANLYPLAARAAQQRAMVLTLGAPDLPAYPGDGTSSCKSNCRCYWSLEPITLPGGAAGWNATWIDVQGPDECTECQDRAGEWNPLQVAGASR
jgi:hypothetical protein